MENLTWSDCVSGEVYYHHTGMFGYIIIFDRIEWDSVIGSYHVCISTEDNYASTNYNNYSNIKELRLATPSEKENLLNLIRKSEDRKFKYKENIQPQYEIY